MVYNDIMRMLGHVHVNMSCLIEVHGCSDFDTVVGIYRTFCQDKPLSSHLTSTS